jgi:hypothetical protein
MLIEVALLLGGWRQPCDQFVVREEHFSASQVVFVETNYQDDGCEIPVLESRSQGDYFIGEELPLQPPGRAMDFHFAKVELRGRSAEVIQWLRQQKFCGISHWELNHYVEVTGKDCEFSLGKIQVPAVGDRRFGIFRVESNKLYLGKLTPIRDGKSKESRPTDWDPRPFLRVDQEFADKIH